jgi:TDG/mug DNA glycosylase family protein
VPNVRSYEPFKPTAADLNAAKDLVIPDVIGPNLRVLFCGINPGLYSAAIGHHFGRPGNRFWPALHTGGFTPRLFSPFEDRALLELGLGITNVVARASARADELTREELGQGAKVLERKAKRFRPQWVAFLGIGAYRHAFDRRKAKLGRQPEKLAQSEIWVLPNPSGLNAHFQGAELARLFRELRKSVAP